MKSADDSSGEQTRTERREFVKSVIKRDTGPNADVYNELARE